MKPSRSPRSPVASLLLGAAALLLAACTGGPAARDAGDPTADRTDGVAIDSAEVRSLNFDPTLLDESGSCRLWAQNRDGRHTRPCAGEVPTCGPAIPASQVRVITVAPQASEALASSPGTDSAEVQLVTGGFYRFLIANTTQIATQQLIRAVAREGCDVLMVDGVEWLRLDGPQFSRTARPYLRVQWGRGANPYARTTPATMAMTGTTVNKTPPR